MRRTASVMSSLPVENELRKKSSTRPYRSRSPRRPLLRASRRPRDGRRRRPPAEPDVADAGEAGGAEAVGEPVGVGVVGERVGQVAIGRLRAAEKSADERNQAVEVQVEKPAEQRVGRLGDVEVHEPGARFEHPPRLAQRGDDVDDVAHREAHRRAVERVVGKRQRHHVGFDERGPGASILALRPHARAGEHRRAEVGAGHGQRAVRCAKDGRPNRRCRSTGRASGPSSGARSSAIARLRQASSTPAVRI